MFTLADTRLTHHCEGFSRRDFLKVGALGIGGLTLSTLMEAKAAGVPLTGKSVVLLFLQGGAPHIEFFDPKMSAPAEYRSITGEIKTRIPGVTFGSTFPQLAARADQIAVVRSYGSKNGGHTYASVSTAGNNMKAAMGSIFSRVAGSHDPETGLPNNILVLPEAVQPGLKLNSNFETQALPSLTQPGELGASMAAFNPSGASRLKSDMEIRIDADRFQSRKTLLDKLDAVRRRVDESGSMETADRFHQQAYDIISNGIGQAFDLSREDPKTLAKYDTSRLFDARDLQKWHDMKRASNQLGRQMLMARRLVESGCGFVTVSDCGWDYHANNNSPKNMAGLYPMGNQVDHAVSAFMDDIRERGLSEKVLLVVTSEMGRSPKLNKNGGRDHYGNLTSLMFAGGGLNMGQVIGESNSTAAEPATFPYTPKHLLATIMHTLFDIGELRVTSGLPEKIIQLANEAEPIRELV